MSRTGKPRFIYSPDYYCDIGAHVFPMRKFRLVRDALLADGDIRESDFLLPPAATREELALVHTERYLDDLFALRMTSRTIPSELPISDQIVRAFALSAGGTTRACLAALDNGLAMNLAGGFHHAFPDHAEGFCYINDVAVAVRILLNKDTIRRAAIVDLDVHQGNGTAFIFQGQPDVYTFSMHQENNYPVKQRSDLDIGLPDGIEDEEYIALLARALPDILDSHKPQLVVYLAGADPYEQDMLGGLGLTLEGLRRRDACVIDHCRRRAIPLAAVLAGGYAADVSDTIRIHHATARLIWETAEGKRPQWEGIR